MNKMPTKTLEQIREKMNMPEGTVVFQCKSEDLMNPKHPSVKIFDIVSGAHIFRLERDDHLLLKFYYASAGTSTRVATIDLNKAVNCKEATIFCTWSPENISLSFGPMVKESKLLSSKGTACEFQLQVGEDGRVYQIGDKGIEVANIAVFQNGKKVLSPTAIKSWESTKKALEILQTGKSKEGYIYETIVANFAISILVTGFETYIKKRVIELEKEGVSLDMSSFLNGILSQYQKEENFAEKYKKIAKNEKLSLLEYIIKERIVNFQNYKQCKLTFNKLFGIKFGDLDIDEKKILELKAFINFRHRIIHDSVFNDIVNQGNVPSEEPIFSNSKLAKIAIDTFDVFINKLHEATLLKR